MRALSSSLQVAVGVERFRDRQDGGQPGARFDLPDALFAPVVDRDGQDRLPAAQLGGI